MKSRKRFSERENFGENTAENIITQVQCRLFSLPEFPEPRTYLVAPIHAPVLLLVAVFLHWMIGKTKKQLAPCFFYL